MASHHIILPLLCLFIALSWAYPDKAPGEACYRYKPNHGGKSLPLDTFSYIVEATSSTFAPGETIAGMEKI